MLEKTKQAEGREPGTVVVEVDVKAPPLEVWDALTDPAIVRRWFGELSAPLKDGASSRLDFGDGDFFMIEDVICRAPERLAYFWRFQGTGPRDTVVWDVIPTTTGSRVCVTDNEPSRSPKVVDELFEGWTDFLGRLQRHIATGETTRYDWRREFSSAAELPGTPEQNRRLLTHLDTMNAWMPFRANGLTKNGAVGMKDGLAPQRLTVSDFKRGTGTSMSFSLRAEEWRSPTTCRIEIVPHANGSLLVVSHGGWEHIGHNGEYQKNQRHRFGDQWVESMRRVLKVAAKSLC
jgi:uncharacterized protein YndB with AHSA1/START domain